MTLKIKIFFLILFFALSADSVFAAEIYFLKKDDGTQASRQFQANILLNTQGDKINAIEGKIIFPSDKLELKEIKDANSVINLWIEKPRIQTENEIIFSGITPGGFEGNNGLIFSAVFLAKEKGQGIVQIQNAKALINDGSGAEIQMDVKNLEFTISDQDMVSSFLPSPENDTGQPEVFKPEIAQSPGVFEGKWFLVFSTQDKGSGIERYEIKETRWKFLSRFLGWNPAESPYVLKDQKLKSYIFVRARDKSGNERLAELNPKYKSAFYQQPAIYIIALLVLLLIVWRVKIKFFKK